MKELAQISQICYKCLHRRPKCLRFYSIPFGLNWIDTDWMILTCFVHFFDLDKMQLLSRPRLRVKALQTQLAQDSPRSPSIWSWIKHDISWSICFWLIQSHFQKPPTECICFCTCPLQWWQSSVASNGVAGNGSGEEQDAAHEPECSHVC